MNALEPTRVKEAEALPGLRLRLRFTDGLEGVLNLSRDLSGPVFASLRDPAVFAEARADYGTVVWPGDIDMAPEYLREKLLEQAGTPGKVEQDAAPNP